MSCHVALVGVGLVGKQVIHQLSSLPSLFRIISLANSKHYVSIAPSNSAKLSAQELIDLLPSSRDKLPDSPGSGIEYESFEEVKQLIDTIISKYSKSSTKTSTILIDCTSDLSLTELYPSVISSSISVVTPNKKGFSSSSKLWSEIVKAQAQPQAGLVYLEATVGAGLPIISTLKDLIKTGDRVNKVEGVLSGTFSYIFNEFSKPNQKGGPKFSQVVKIAKENGYTEPHPADDLSGSDVARKLTILSRLISGADSTQDFPEGYASLPTESLIPKELEGIKSGEEFVKKLPEFDAHFDEMRDSAEKEGKVLRYVGVIDRESGVVKCGLEKYPAAHPFASSLSGADNIIAFHTSRYSTRPLIVQGAGAGADVTAMGVVADAIKVAERTGSVVHL